MADPGAGRGVNPAGNVEPAGATEPSAHPHRHDPHRLALPMQPLLQRERSLVEEKPLDAGFTRQHAIPKSLGQFRAKAKRGAYERLLLSSASPPSESNPTVDGSGTSEATRNPKLWDSSIGLKTVR